MLYRSIGIIPPLLLEILYGFLIWIGITEFASKYKSDIENKPWVRERLDKIGDMDVDAQLRALNELEHDIYIDHAKKVGLNDEQANISRDKHFREYPESVKQENIDTSKPVEQQIDVLYKDALVADGDLKTFTKKIADKMGRETGSILKK